MAQFNLIETDPDEISTPDTGKTAIFMDSVEGVPKYRRSDGIDHPFPEASLSSETPQDVGVTGSAGSSFTGSKSDHVHAHGAQTDGTMHAEATTGTAGFLSASDKTKLDGVASSAAALGSSDPADISDDTPDDGSATVAAKEDHVHAHGERGGGTLHDEATTSVAGFLSASDKTKLDGVSSGAVSDHGALSGLSDDDHTQYIKHDLATAADDFLVASGIGVFIKKTLAEVKSILGLGSAAYTASSDYAPAAQGVTGGDSHDHNGGDGAQIDHVNLANKGTNTHSTIDTFISSKGQASGLAPLDGSSKVDSYVSDATTSTKGKASFDTNDFTVTSGAVTIKDSGIDHGSLTGLGDNDHTQYPLKSVLTAKGSIYAASGASTPAELLKGTDGYYLQAASGEATGLKWASLTVPPALPVFNVKDYGALGDDSHDDTADIQEAIDACATAKGGIVYFPVGRYKITATLNVNYNMIHLMGAGSAYTTDVGDFTQAGGSMIVWRGSSAGTMISAQPMAIGASGTALLGLKITDLTIEGRNYGGTAMAGIGLSIKSAHGWFLQNLFFMDFSTVALDLNVLSAGSIGEAHDTTRGIAQRICIRQLDEGGASGIGMRLDGSATANACLNEFNTFQISHTNGIAIKLLNSDTNEFNNISINRSGGGTAVGVEINGSTVGDNYTARNNVFFSCSAGAGGCTVRGTSSGATYPSLDTHWHDYQVGNGEPVPVIETAANMIFNANGTQNGGSFSTLLGNIPALQLSSNVTTNVTTRTSTNLSFPIRPSEQWYVECNIVAQCSSTGGVKYAINAPTGTTVEGGAEGVVAGSTSTTRVRISAIDTLTSNAMHTTANVPLADTIRVFIKGSTTAGNVTLQFASTTAGQTSTILAGSTMRAQKVQIV
jgi:polygalacturonase